MTDINRKQFFNAIRPHGGEGFTQQQVDSINTLLDEGVSKMPNVQALAYLMATAYHETGMTMLPIAEYDKGRGMDYGKALDMGSGPGHRVPYKGSILYYGRGYVQITWRINYKGMVKITGKDLVADPELALQPDVAAVIAVQGMLRGYFTGKMIKDYFPNKAGKHDPLNARRIINGLDCSKKIADYYTIILHAFQTNELIA